MMTQQLPKTSGVNGFGSASLDLDILDGMEDLLSVGSGTLSPQHHNDLGHDKAQGLLHGGEDSPEVDSWRLSNAVHMEVQENARLPTFNWPVDRSGSVGSRSAPAAFDLDELARLGEEDLNLTELFLKSQSRASFNANYANSRALERQAAAKPESFTSAQKPSTERDMPDNILSTEKETKEAEVMEFDIDPTPLSEIKRRHDEFEKLHHRGEPAVPQAMNHAYGRSKPLPIPTKAVSPVNLPAAPPAGAAPPILDDAVARAVATAAAIATQATTAVSTIVPDPTVELQPHAKKHSNPTGAITSASKQQSQYGFGRKHVVPSIPASSRKKALSITAPAPKKKPPPPPSPTPSSASGNGAHGGAAYERKKQRAKDSRIKFNDSVDRLAIAISLAGTQSKQRMDQWENLPSSTNHRQAGLQIMADCTKMADSAKKWDRPSFVGSAASIIQGLNAQCEALMRELLACHEQQKAVTPIAPVIGTAATVVTKRPPPSAPAPSETDEPVASKRPRTEVPVDDASKDSLSLQDKALPAGFSIFSERSVLDRLSLFLDPVSLVRCGQVCQAWKKCGIFSGETVWQDLAASRFGFYNVRQWKGKLDDEESGVQAAPMSLYRSMDAANVMPHLQQENVFLLGEARLPGKVSAWTYLVERSNGETLRSVRREKLMPGVGIYASLPVVELHTVIQNTGVHDHALIVRKQVQSVDVSTRRRGEEMKEIDWDDRFKKRIRNLDGTLYKDPRPQTVLPTLGFDEELCRLKLFETVVLETYIHARGCSTTSKFVQRSNFTKILIQISGGTTVPLVIPFPRDAAHLLH